MLPAYEHIMENMTEVHTNLVRYMHKKTHFSPF